jgi:phosphoribosylcarboxyaminoimidazole (NCAIR) mutase
MSATVAGAAARLAGEYAGWIVWTSKPVATRAALGRAPRNDGVWAATIMADSWAELERKLAEQAANDAARG